MSTYTCPYCRVTSDLTASQCPACGAPLDAAHASSAGWTQLPAVADRTRIQMGHSSATILGVLCPVAEIKLSGNDTVLFPAHTLLWSDVTVTTSEAPMRRGWQRTWAGQPVSMLEGTGPGTVAVSADTPGEMVAVPLQPGQAIDVREHRMVAAGGSVSHDFYDSDIWFRSRSGGSVGDAGAASSLLGMALDLSGVDVASRRDQTDVSEIVYPLGFQVDRFAAGSEPGVVVLQAGGDVSFRDLAAGETVLVKPPSVLFKDPEVSWELHVEFPSAGAKLWRSWANRYLWLRLAGPGRVALQSNYDRLADPGGDFAESCRFTQRAW